MPFWSFSHRHREKLFEKILSSEFRYSLFTDLEYEKTDFLEHETKFSKNFDDKKFGKKIKFNENFDENYKTNNYNYSKNIINKNNNNKNSNLNYNKLFRILTRPIEYGNQIFSIHFNKLNLNFYRKHYGGGNEIKCFAENFVIVGAESKFSGKIGEFFILFTHLYYYLF